MTRSHEMSGMGGSGHADQDRHAGHFPVAAGILVPWGIDLPMAVGAIAMSASTISVAANAQLLRGLSLRREPAAVEAQPLAA